MERDKAKRAAISVGEISEGRGSTGEFQPAQVASDFMALRSSKRKFQGKPLRSASRSGSLPKHVRIQGDAGRRVLTSFLSCLNSEQLKGAAAVLLGSRNGLFIVPGNQDAARRTTIAYRCFTETEVLRTCAIVFIQNTDGELVEMKFIGHSLDSGWLPEVAVFRRVWELARDPVNDLSPNRKAVGFCFHSLPEDTPDDWVQRFAFEAALRGFRFETSSHAYSIPREIIRCRHVFTFRLQEISGAIRKPQSQFGHGTVKELERTIPTFEALRAAFVEAFELEVARTQALENDVGFSVVRELEANEFGYLVDHRSLDGRVDIGNSEADE